MSQIERKAILEEPFRPPRRALAIYNEESFAMNFTTDIPMLRSIVLAITGFLVWIWPAGDLRAAGELARYERSEWHMGTRFTITLFAAETRQAEDAFRAAFGRIEQLDRMFSDYRADSEVSRLGASAPHPDPVPVSPDTWRVLYRAQEVSRASDGAFDVTVGPLTRLWRRARRRRELPPVDRLAQARALTGLHLVQLHEATRSVQLKRAGMRLDLGGIAKGDALDQAMVVLRQHGVTRALINGGGDVLAGDAPPNSGGWRVGLIRLDDDQVTDSIQLANRAAATSGDLWRYVQIGATRYSHIVDPKTGLGLQHRSLVTVTAQRAIDADAFASTVSVLGPEKGMQLIASVTDVEVRILHHGQGGLTTLVSDGFPR